MRPNDPGRRAFRDHRFFLALLAVNVLFARLAMRLYGEHFVLLQHAISDLGATVTRNGFPNPRAPFVFAVQMAISSVMCFRYSLHLASQVGQKDNRIWLLRLGGSGFFLMPAPHNLPVTHYVHMFGAGLVFFMLWMFAMIYLFECRTKKRAGVFWVGMFILQSTVLTYAFMFAIDWEHKQFTQGIGLLGVIGVVIWTALGLAAMDRAESGAIEADLSADRGAGDRVRPT